jgi:HEAT repeat protein
MLRPAVLLTLVSIAAAEDQGPHAEGLDVVQAAKAVKEWVAPASHGDKPWSDDLAALSGEDQARQRRAIANLIRRGPVVLPDLSVLAKDRDWLLRSRVVEVAEGIGGAEPAPLLLQLTRDPEVRVREAATLGLGRCSGDGVFDRLAEQLAAPEPDVRVAAARAMGATGDVRALAPLAKLDTETDDLAKRAMHDALGTVARRIEAVPELARLLGSTTGKQRDALVESTLALADPRLCPPLVALLALGTPPYTQWLALRALASNGDSRAWQTLCHIAAEAPEGDLRTAASNAMRALAGKDGTGEVWALWWRDHSAEAPRAMERDALIADLHDPQRAMSREELGRFSIEELSPLLEGALGAGASWWPARAFSALRADDPRRWDAALVKQANETPDSMRRLALITFVDELGGPDCVASLRAIDKALRARVDAEEAQARDGHFLAPDHGPELLALKVALERHGAQK